MCRIKAATTLMLHLALASQWSSSVSSAVVGSKGNPVVKFGELTAKTKPPVNYASLGDPEHCGFSGKSSDSVQNAQQSRANDWPWLAVFILKTTGEHFCGGVLITQRDVLTAAHCFPEVLVKNPQYLTVRLGEIDFTKTNDSYSEDFDVEEVIEHEGYDRPINENDLTIVRLKTPVKFAIPICLPSTDKYISADFQNSTAVVAGWGATSYKGKMSDVLMEVPIPIWDQKTCEDSFTQIIFDTNICAGGLEGGKDSCQGDSGGPLMVQRDDQRWMTVGVVSWGIKCGEKGKPGTYARVNKYLDWIASVIH